MKDFGNPLGAVLSGLFILGLAEMGTMVPVWALAGAISRDPVWLLRMGPIVGLLSTIELVVLGALPGMLLVSFGKARFVPWRSVRALAVGAYVGSCALGIPSAAYGTRYFGLQLLAWVLGGIAGAAIAYARLPRIGQLS